MKADLYDDARVYDRLFPGHEKAIAYYRSVAGQQPASRVLELGSGTGTKLIPLAADGHRCVGLELSSPMLDEARRKAAARGVEVTWVHGDMRSFDVGHGAFDLVFVTANSLLHLHRSADLLGCLTTARRHLAPGGRLVLDVFIPTSRCSPAPTAPAGPVRT